MFRKHQDQFGQICQAIRTGQSPQIKTIICSTTPGGGKSMLPVIAASQLLGVVADRICWVVPRRSLQQQAEQEFVKQRTRQLLSHSHTIRRSTNEPDPCRGLAGFATTYQAIGMNNVHLREEFRHRRYILVLDEPHHIEEGGAWEVALAPLVKRAALTVFMSGTLERGNRRRIAFLPYRWGPDGEVVDLSPNESTSVINYSRRDALREKAILPIHFELRDATAEWIGVDGATYSRRLSEANHDTAEALYTALKTQFAEQLLDECIDHWRDYRRAHPRSKLLVVTANIEDAKKYVEHLRAQGISTDIATSDDSALAARNIEAFRRVSQPDPASLAGASGGNGISLSRGAAPAAKTKRARTLDALVTVAMAYEGLDVPAVTHIACLTHIRSRPWIEQMIARATRFDAPAGPWDEQTAYIYVPDDRYMCAIIRHMQEDQAAAIKQMVQDEIDESVPLEELPPGERNFITPVGSQIEERRWSQVGQELQVEPNPAQEILTPSQMEDELREQIHNYCKQVDLNLFDRQWGETNKRIAKWFKKPRSQMTQAELNRVLRWLEESFPNGGVPHAPRPLAALTRR